MLDYRDTKWYKNYMVIKTLGKRKEPKIDEKEWMKATEPSVGELPETVVEAKTPDNLLDQYLGKLKTVGEKVEKAIDVVGKPLVKYGRIGVAPLIGKPLAEVGGAAVGIPFEVAKRPFKDIQIPHYAEKRGKAMQGFVKNFMKPEGKKSAQEFMDIERKMTEEGLLPESRAITLPIEMYFAARILGRGVAKVEDKIWWDKFLQKNYEKQVFSQEDVETIVSKIRRALIDGGEDPSKAKDIFKTVLTAKELKVRVGSTQSGLPIYKTIRPRYLKGQVTPGKGASYWTPKQINEYADDVYKITTEKGALPFRPKTVYPGTAEIETQRGITPAGKLAPKVAGVTKQLVSTEPSTAGVPTFLSPKTQELMAMERLRTVGGYPQVPPMSFPPEGMGGKKSIIVYHQSDTGKLHKGKDVYGLGADYYVSKKKLPDGFYGKYQTKIELPKDTKLFNFQEWAKNNKVNLRVPVVKRTEIFKQALNMARKEGYDGIEYMPDDIRLFFDPKQLPRPPTPTKERVVLSDIDKRHLKAWEGKGVESVAPKKELLMTRPHVRVYKPESAKMLAEKYREAHGGEEPPLLNEAEIAREVERVLTEPMVAPSKQVLAGTGVEPYPPQQVDVRAYGYPTHEIHYPGQELYRGGKVKWTGEVPEHLRGMIPRAVEKEMPPQIKPKHLTSKIQSLELGKNEKTVLDMIRKGEIRTKAEGIVIGKKLGIAKNEAEWNAWLEKTDARIKERSVVRDLDKRLKKVASEAKHMEAGFQKDLDDVVGGIDPKKMTKKKLHALTRMQEYFANPDNADQFSDVSPRKVAELGRLSKKSRSELTVDEYREVVETAEHIVRLNQIKRKLIVRGQLREVKKEIARVANNINRSSKISKLNEDTVDLTKTGKGISAAKGVTKFFTTTHYHMETVAAELDAGDIEGTFNKYFVEPANESINTELKYKHEAKDHVKNSLSKSGINQKQLEKIAGKKHTVTLTGDRKITISGGQRIEIMAIAHNKKNYHNLVNSGRDANGRPMGGIRSKLNETKWISLNKKDLQTILQSSTPEERTTVRVMLDYYNNIQAPQLDAVHQRIKGYPLTIDDWYFPNARSRYDIHIEKHKNFSKAMLENSGFTKERTSIRKPFLIGSAFDDFYRNIERVGRYIGWVENLRNMRMIIGDGKVKQTITAKRGKYFVRFVEDWIDDIEGFSTKQDPMTSWWQRLRHSSARAILAQPFIWGKQTVSYGLAALRMPLSHLAGAIRPYPVSPKTLERMVRINPQSRERFEGQAVTIELGEIGMTGASGKFWFNKKNWKDYFTAGLRAMDKQTVGRIWESCERWVKADSPNLTGDAFDQEVSRRWDHVMQTQPMFHPAYRSPLGRSKDNWTRMSTMFTTQRNAIYNLAQQERIKYKYSGRTPKDKMMLLYGLGIIAANAAAITAYNEGSRRLMLKKKRKLWQLALETIGGGLSYTFYLGDLFSIVASQVERGRWGGFDYETPVTQLITNTGSGIAGLIKAGIELAGKEIYQSGEYEGEKKWFRTVGRAFDRLLQPIGVALGGIPIANAKRFAQSGRRWWQLLKGEEIYPDEEETLSKKDRLLGTRR